MNLKIDWTYSKMNCDSNQSKRRDLYRVIVFLSRQERQEKSLKIYIYTPDVASAILCFPHGLICRSNVHPSKCTQTKRSVEKTQTDETNATTTERARQTVVPIGIDDEPTKNADGLTDLTNR